jgi:hypothetical protein
MSIRGTLVSQIEVPVRLFFFAFFPQPVCLIWAYVFISLKKKNCLFAYLGHVCLLATFFFRILPNKFINNLSKKPVNNDFFSHYKFWGKHDT